MNKKIRQFLGATLLMGAAGVANAGIIELTVNGDFETGDFTGWTQFLNGGSQSIAAGNGGGSAANLGAFQPSIISSQTPLVSPAPNPLIKNANIGIGQVTPGQSITVMFDVRGTTSSGGVAFAEFFSELAGGGVSSAEILGGVPLPLSTNWQTLSFTTTAGPDVSGGVTLQLVAVCGAVAACESDIFFDNASVTIEVEDVPAPATLFLFGLGLAAAGWARRRSA